MARRTAAIEDSSPVFVSRSAEPALDGDFDSAAPAMDSQEQAFEDLRNESEEERSGKFVWVHLVPTDDKGNPLGRGREEHLFTLPIDAMTLDQIVSRVRDEFMGEEKRWMLRITVRQQGVRGVLTNMLKVVRNSPQYQENKKAGGIGEVMGAVKDLVSAQQARSDQLLQQIAAMNQRPAPVVESFNMRDMLAMQQQSTAQTIAMMTALLGAVGNRNADAGDPVEKVVKMMTSLSALRSEMGGENDSGMGGIVRAVAPMAIEAMKTMQASRAHPGHEPQRIAAPVTLAPAPTPSPNPQPPSDDAMIAQLREQLATLAEIAAEKPDAKLIAEQTMTLIPEEFDEKLYAVLSGANWFATLCALQPKISVHQEWMTQVRNEILASFQDTNPQG